MRFGSETEHRSIESRWMDPICGIGKTTRGDFASYATYKSCESDGQGLYEPRTCEVGGRGSDLTIAMGRCLPDILGGDREHTR